MFTFILKCCRWFLSPTHPWKIRSLSPIVLLVCSSFILSTFTRAGRNPGWPQTFVQKGDCLPCYLTKPYSVGSGLLRPPLPSSSPISFFYLLLPPSSIPSSQLPSSWRYTDFYTRTLPFPPACAHPIALATIHHTLHPFHTDQFALMVREEYLARGTRLN